MYLPPNSKSLKTMEADRPPIRLGLMGRPGTGKTTSALTFPNPLVLDFDNKLAAHSGKDIAYFPFWSKDFLKKVDSAKPNGRDALLKFLVTEGPKFTPDQTVILDSFTLYQDALDTQLHSEPEYGVDKQGNRVINKLAFWGNKMECSRQMMNVLVSLKCNLVVTFHETPDTDDEGRRTGKLLPVMQGKFAFKLGSYFNCWFRQHAKPTMIKNKANIEVEDPTGPINYLWQTRSDATADCLCALPIEKELPTFIPANYNALWTKYNQQ